MTCWLLLAAASAAEAAEFSGARALEDTRRVVAFGPRPPGSPELAKTRAYIVQQLRPTGCLPVKGAFVATVPGGTLAMENVICRFPGKSGKAVAFTGHYDSKFLPGENFVAANDGGASTGLLIELARALARAPRVHDVYLVWFDGEEAIRQWSATDGLHGSRNLAEKWQADGTLARLVALVNVDMIGDKDLGVMNEQNSDARVRTLLWKVAADLGFGRHFLSTPNWIEDDHIPFVKLGAPAADLIDFDYGPNNSHWHTAADTTDKLAASSFDVIGKVLLEFLRRVEAGALPSRPAKQ
ncbi:MAG: M28 family peptidase [Bryobacterales bacterium]|nr:M28 family peptidase [Bryobacterales bacterium]